MNGELMRIKVDSKSKMQQDKKPDYESLATFIVKTSSPHNTWRFVTLISMPFSVSFSSLFHKYPKFTRLREPFYFFSSLSLAK